MKPRFSSMGMSVWIAMVGLTQPSFAQGEDSKSKERIGIYDSRAIAVAFAGSPMHEKQLRQLLAEHKRAKEVGDLETVAKLEAEGKARQQKAHQQAFSTAPVDEILVHITNALPDIQRTAELVQEIASASREQNQGANQINQAIQQMDQVIQKNAGAAEEMAATSEELSAQADIMESAVAFFKVDETRTSQPLSQTRDLSTHSPRAMITLE